MKKRDIKSRANEFDKVFGNCKEQQCQNSIELESLNPKSISIAVTNGD